MHHGKKNGLSEKDAKSQHNKRRDCSHDKLEHIVKSLLWSHNIVFKGNQLLSFLCLAHLFGVVTQCYGKLKI